MSEMINNREQVVLNTSERQSLLETIINDIQNGKPVANVKDLFMQIAGSITASELSQLEHRLKQAGVPIDDIHYLCSVHASALKHTEDTNQTKKPEEQPGHPVHTFILENREILKLLNTRLQPNFEVFIKEDNPEIIFNLIEDLNLMLDVDKHYSRKENLLFPYLEKYGIYSPTQVMWRYNDFIRDAIKDSKRKLTNYNGDKSSVIQSISFIIREVLDMIAREENVLFPVSLKTLTEDEWIKIAHESDEIGYCLTGPAGVWKPERKELHTNAMSEGFIRMETGVLSIKQLELLLNHLPVDITFIDHNDVVRYFSHGKDRIFARTKAVIGRTVQNCHPPRSVHTVEELLEDFKAGRKDSEDFWIKFKDHYVYIRYFAVRNELGEYIGTLEFTQNINPIQEIEGEKRMLT
ncbi:DUF438 domain-containing protein [Bacillus sp. DNRA2]|uniref:DUF438 domain-containing protein n=1 Tax=Bacillus sp. DNRA2 TaxID=2723053 RepID=UPI00145E3E37|nr:DUF438 domain-containing protein [Bacillus sp. DNRA2]NMD71692.1 DUF438 domain-containing protein [Bacillus sp. DNRA2]